MLIKPLKLKPSSVKSTSITLPGSKSISNRVLLLASLANGKSHIKNLLFSEDTMLMISALKKLGIKLKENEDLKDCIINGSNNFFPSKKNDLFIGNAGTVIRPLTAALAFNNGDYTLHGNDRMHERPIGDLVDSLNSIGAKIQYINKKGYPPLKIINSKVKKNVIKVKGTVSSQFLTSILISSPMIAKYESFKIEVVGELISRPYIDMTINLMQIFGIYIKEVQKNYFLIQPNQIYKSPNNLIIESDASSASYFLAAAAISGATIKVKGVGKNSIQGDIQFINILEQMGAKIQTGKNWIEVTSNTILKPIDADLNHIPDAAMTLAVLALYADGITTLRNIGSWRVKETDRLSAMSNELRKLGAIITEGEDFLVITPPKRLTPAIIETYDDHRIAMSFSLASLNSNYKKGTNITIKNPNCVSKTFPNFFDYFNHIIN